MNEPVSLQKTAKLRLVQIFRFLKELNQLRNPVPRDLSAYRQVMRLDSWPQHPCVEIRRGDRPEPGSTGAQGRPLLRIRRPPLTPCPKPLEELDGWLKPGWRGLEADVELVRSRNLHVGERGVHAVAFDSDPERVAALQLWGAARAEWQLCERPARAARGLFERIHALWTTLHREGDRVELLLADGMLDVEDFGVRHPVLMQRIHLEFEPSGPEFRFSAGTEKVELNRALLGLLPIVEGRTVAQLDEDLEHQGIEPLGAESTEGFLRRLVHALFNDGEFSERKTRGEGSHAPCVWREPLLFLRPRTAGLSATLDRIVEDLESEQSEVPEALARIAGIEIPELAPAASEVAARSAAADPDVLFSKPANAEQYQIAERLAHTRAVLVQGPPGTGKTHTIANLLGCLLAQGRTVLVTAHTTKALRVLRSHVDAALQALCLSVLEGEADSHAQLSRAAQDIADRLSAADAGALRREASQLRDERRQLLRSAEMLRWQLLGARVREVEEVVLGAEGLSPIEVAKRLKAGADSQSWIPGPLQSGAVCPLGDAEVRQLYAAQHLLTPSDDVQLAVAQPDLRELVRPADFRLRAAERAGADSRARAHRPELWVEAAATLPSARIAELHQRLKPCVAILSDEQSWLREVLFASWTGGGLQQAWYELLAALDALMAQAGEAQRVILEYGPELPRPQQDLNAAEILAEIIEHLEGGGSLGTRSRWLRPRWHRLIELCRVGGRPPRSLDEFRALHAIALLKESRDRFSARWRRAVESHGGPSVSSLGRLPERVAQAHVPEIRKRLEWRTKIWEPLLEDLRRAGFLWDAWLSEHRAAPGLHGDVARVQRAGSAALLRVVEARAALLRQGELADALAAQRTYLGGFPESDAAAVLLHAQDAWDPDRYEQACRELARLEGLRETHAQREALIAQLEPAAPAWVHALRQRSRPHDGALPPGEVAAAWRWRQWHQELEKRAAVSMSGLQERLDKAEDELRQLAARIIEHEAWAAQRERTGLHAQQALMGFVQTIRKIGEGSGRRAPELLRRARQLLAAARHAVPVWIMPLSRVYESFDPRDGRFDVVIIDEASQSDVTALAALYLGREHLVVGDKEQVTPDAIGQRISEVQRLISSNLQGIPNSHLYDGQTSIYDLAETAFGGVIALREHFRCVPEIIQFSNHLSYNETIRPLREPFSAQLLPAVVAHRVDGLRPERGRINPVEADEIASLLVACTNDPDYANNEVGRPTSFGIISLQGEEQALLIESLLRRRLSPQAFHKHRVLCGDAAHFQGDERDVVFLSVVDGPLEDGPLAYRDAGPKDLYKKRYNVAVSRARNQLWVVHSLDPEAHLKPGDLRRRLIEYARDPLALVRGVEDPGRRTDAGFENLVFERLRAAGYRVHAQWPVGDYRVALVVEGSARRLAVECDGERWYTPEQLHRDLRRQAVLERLGWTFVRVRGSLFFRDPYAAMAPVFDKLRQLGIETLGSRSRSEDEPAPSAVARIVEAARALRREWNEEDHPVEAVEVDATVSA